MTRTDSEDEKWKALWPNRAAVTRRTDPGDGREWRMRRDERPLDRPGRRLVRAQCAAAPFFTSVISNSFGHILPVTNSRFFAAS
jgi:hypothetical protein